MIWAIVTAAGRSLRMGEPKLLLPVGTKPMITHVVDQLLPAVEGVLVVVPADGRGIPAALGDRPVRCIHNPDPAADMLSSIRVGLRHLPPEAAGALVALGDNPGITTAVVQALRAGHAGRMRITVPVFAGRRGHPVLVGSGHFPEVLSAHDGVGLRGLLMAHRDLVVEVPVASPDILHDVDTPEDYQRHVLGNAGRSEV
jgi:molybdenum cofactor cytidylyltransferase